MIHEVDEALTTTIESGLNGTSVEVVLDAPTKEWAARRNAPTLNLYLYDIREDTGRRQAGQVAIRNDQQHVDTMVYPARWYKLSYLLTAWTQRSGDEHRLLSAILAHLLRSDRLTPEHLGGSIADLGVPITYTCALPPPQDRAISDIWSALGGELKPSLDIVVTAPFDINRDWPVAPPVLQPLETDVVDLREAGPADADTRTAGRSPARGTSEGSRTSEKSTASPKAKAPEKSKAPEKAKASRRSKAPEKSPGPKRAPKRRR